MKETLKKFYLKQQFQPNILGAFFSPFFIARYALYQEVRKSCSAISGRVLDIGCGSKPYENLCSATEYIGLEFDSEANRKNTKADAFYDGKVFPFKENEFDYVICNQVLEHVFNPDSFLREIGRVLKPSGRVLITVPFIWVEHEQPVDYARYTSFGLKYLLNKNGFRILYLKKLNPGLSTILQLKISWLYQKIQMSPSPKLLILLSSALFCLPNLMYFFFLRKESESTDLYLDNLIFVEKP